MAVQSGDDVIVIDRCGRQTPPFNRLHGHARTTFTKLSVDLYLNGGLTLGTKIYEESDGKKYIISLPHGTYVKVMVSGELLNVWIVASPKDYMKTVGLCGTNDEQMYNDLQLRDGRIMPYVPVDGWNRHEPREFCVDWRVEIYGENSLFRGVVATPEHMDSPPVKYCSCLSKVKHCGYAVDVALCDTLQGRDVTDMFVSRAKTSQVSVDDVRRRRRRQTKRDIHDNRVDKNPIIVDTNFIPPVGAAVLCMYTCIA